jgi:hypothetical protein
MVNVRSDPVPLSTTGVVQSPCYSFVRPKHCRKPIADHEFKAFSVRRIILVCASPRAPVARGTTFRTVTNTVYSIITAVLPLHTKMCISSLAPRSSQGHRSLQNCGSSVRNLLRIASLAPRKCRPLCFRHQYERPREKRIERNVWKTSPISCISIKIN